MRIQCRAQYGIVLMYLVYITVGVTQKGDGVLSQKKARTMTVGDIMSE